MKTFWNGITNYAFYCNKFAETFHFYGDVLELEHLFTRRDDAGQAIQSVFKVGEKQFIVLNNKAHEGAMFWENLSCTHIAIEVNDIFAVARMLEGKGVMLTKGPRADHRMQALPYSIDPEIAPCGSYTAWLRDPEGNEMELMQYTDASMQHCCGE